MKGIIYCSALGERSHGRSLFSGAGVARLKASYPQFNGEVQKFNA